MRRRSVITLFVMLLLILITVKGALGDVFINEINPTGTDEWIELYNDGSDVDLTGWTIEDNTGSTHAFQTGSNTGNSLTGLTILAGDYLVLDDTIFSFTLNNGGDIVILKDDTSSVIEQVAYDSFDDGDTSDNAPGVSTGETVARIHDGLTTFIASINPTEGEENNRLPSGAIPSRTFDEDVSPSTSINLNSFISDLDGDSLIYSVDSETTSEVDCEISGAVLEFNPASDFNGAASCNIEADDSYDQVTFTVNMDVTSVNDAPSITSTGATAVNEDAAYAYDADGTVDVSDVDDSSFTFSSWLNGVVSSIVDSVSGLITWTPTNDDVGDNTIRIDVSDDEGLVDSQVTTVTVANTNDGPSADDDSDSTNEDTLITTINVLTNDDDVDAGDVLSVSAFDTSLTTGTVTDNTDGTFDYDPNGLFEALDDTESDTDSFMYTVRDVTGATSDGTVTVTINGVNDAPVVTGVSPPTANQAQVETFTVSYTDVDIETSTINTVLSSIGGDSFDILGIVPSGLTFDVIFEDHGDFDLVIVVNDGTDNSVAHSETITVTPAINVDEIRVAINEPIGTPGSLYTPGSSIDVSPGDFISIDFDFINTFDKELGGINSLVYLNDVLDYVGICEGVDCVDGLWALEPSELATFTYEFTVDPAADEDFTVSLDVFDDGFWMDFENSIDVEFTLDKDDVGLTLADLRLTPEVITCTESTILDLDLINVGTEDVVPQLLVYSTERDVDSFDEVTATLDSLNPVTPGVELVRSNLDSLLSGTERTDSLEIDTTDLETGSLYAYLVNAHIDPLDNYIADSGSVLLTRGECVVETLEIVNVVVDGSSITEGSTSSPIKPGDSFIVSATLTNHMSTPITGIETTFIIDGTPYSKKISGIEAGNSVAVSVDVKLPLSTIEGPYSVSVDTIGKDYEFPLISAEDHTDSFAFFLDVDSDPADLYISDLTLTESTLTCATSTTLNYELTNRGSNDETFTVTVTGDGYEDELSEDVISGELFDFIDAGYVSFPISASDLSEGSNTFTVKLEYRDGFETETQTFTVTKGDCLASLDADQSLIIAESTTIDPLDNPLVFTATLAETVSGTSLKWYIDGTEQAGETSTTFTFPDGEAVGDHVVKVVVNDNVEDSLSATVTVRDVPYFNGAPITESASTTTVEKTGVGKVVFDGTDLFGEVVDLDSAITISSGVVSVDSTVLTGLSSATVTIFGTFTSPTILVASDFGATTGFTSCDEPTCTEILPRVSGQITFTVTGFSTYKVVEEAPPAISAPTRVDFTSVPSGESTTATLTVGNLGTIEDLILGVTAVPGTGYSFTTDTTSATLQELGVAGNTVDVTLSMSVPTNVAGETKVGTLTLTGNSNDTLTKYVDVYITPKSFLEITDIEVNNGDDLTINDNNEIEITVENTYTEDMEDVRVTVEVEVDGDDIKERSQRFDLDKGDDKKVTLDFDFSNENVDEEELTFRITVEGTGVDDNSDHETKETFTASFDLENDELSIQKITAPTQLTCSRDANIQVRVLNIGSEDQDDVDIILSNDELGIKVEKRSVSIDNFFDKDNDYLAKFNINLNNVAAGKHNFDIDVYMDGDLEASDVVEIEVKDCLTTSQSTQNLQLTGDQLAVQLKDSLLTGNVVAKAPTKVVSSSFRESTAYTALLAFLLLLVIVAILLAITVALKK